MKISQIRRGPGDLPVTPRFRTAVAALHAAVLSGILGGCSAMPDAVNPVEWWKEAREAVSPMKTPAQRAAEEAGKNARIPGEDKPFPNLASVPKRPKPGELKLRRTEAADLRRDWTIARARDFMVRTEEANLLPPAQPVAKKPPVAAVPAEVEPAPNLVPEKPRIPVRPRIVRRAVPAQPEEPKRAPAPPVFEDPATVPPPPVIESVPDVPPPPPPLFDQRSDRSAPDRFAGVGPAFVRAPANGSFRSSFADRRGLETAGYRGHSGLLWLAGGLPESMRKKVHRLHNVPKGSPFTPPPKPGTAKFGKPPADIAAAESEPEPQKPSSAKPAAKSAPPPQPKAAAKPAPAPEAGRKAEKSTQLAKVDEGKTQQAPTRKATSGPVQIAVPLEREKNVKGRLGVVLFRVGSAKLSPEAVKVINDIVKRHGQTGGKLRVVGHASGDTAKKDPVAHRMANFSMSLDRANAVAQALIKRGISPELVSVSAMADSQPAFSEQNKAGVTRNQRTEIYIDPVETVGKP